MTTGDLVKQILELNSKAPEGVSVEDMEVMLRHPGSMGFTKAKLTPTYVSKSINGTTKYEQVPIILIEEDENA